MPQVARDYELGIVVNPDVGDEQARAVVERITQTIAANGGEVIRVNAVGRRRFAYPIQHHRDGLYFFFDLTMPPTAVVEVERTLRVNEDLIRHLLLVRDPRVVSQQRQREAEAEAQAALQQAEAQVAEAEAATRLAGAPDAETAAEAEFSSLDGEAGELASAVSGEEDEHGEEEATSEAEANA